MKKQTIKEKINKSMKYYENAVRLLYKYEKTHYLNETEEKKFRYSIQKWALSLSKVFDEIDKEYANELLYLSKQANYEDFVFLIPRFSEAVKKLHDMVFENEKIRRLFTKKYLYLIILGKT